MNTLLIVKIVGLIVGAIASVRGKRADADSPRAKRLTFVLVLLGFGTAVVAELVSGSQSQIAARDRQREADDALTRNNAVLAEIQRTLHPLFPLLVEVEFRASLMEAETQGFRRALEQKFHRDSPQNPGIPIVWLHPEDSMFPTCQRDPIGYHIATAELASMVRVYSREKTRAHLEKHEPLSKPDVEFSPSIQRDPPGPGVQPAEDRLRRIVDNRNYEFDPKVGLYISDDNQRIEFENARNTTDLISADDLLGATIEVAVLPFDPADESCGPIPSTLNEAVGFDSVAITLPGWRRLVVGREKFGSPARSEEWPFSYQYTFPSERNEFERLFQSGPRWAPDAPRGAASEPPGDSQRKLPQPTVRRPEVVTPAAESPKTFAEDEELGFRLSQLLTALDQLSEPRNQHKLRAGKSTSDVDALLRRFEAAGNFPHHADQYRNVPATTLLEMLRARIADRATLSAIDRAARALADWNTWIGKHDTMLSDPRMLGGAVIDDLVLPRWRSLEYPFLDCPSSAPFC